MRMLVDQSIVWGVGVLFLLTRDGLLLEEAEEQGQWSAMWMSCGMTSL